MKKTLEAWDGVFTAGQQQELINMLLHARRNHIDLLSAMTNSPPMTRQTERQPNRKQNRVFRPIPKKPCLECKKNLMGLYPVNTDPRGFDRVGTTENEDPNGRNYNSMWLCGTSCNGKGCWHEEYNYYSVEEYRSGILKNTMP